MSEKSEIKVGLYRLHFYKLVNDKYTIRIESVFDTDGISIDQEDFDKLIEEYQKAKKSL